jgi:hypothetical protein
VRSSRVRKFVMVGVPFGRGATGDFRQFILRTCDRWQPILQAQANHSLDPSTLPAQQREQLATGKVAITVAWLSAMLDWPAVMPENLLWDTLAGGFQQYRSDAGRCGTRRGPATNQGPTRGVARSESRAGTHCSYGLLPAGM